MQTDKSWTMYKIRKILDPKRTFAKRYDTEAQSISWLSKFININ